MIKAIKKNWLAILMAILAITAITFLVSKLRLNREFKTTVSYTAWETKVYSSELTNCKEDDPQTQCIDEDTTKLVAKKTGRNSSYVFPEFETSNNDNLVYSYKKYLTVYLVAPEGDTKCSKYTLATFGEEDWKSFAAGQEIKVKANDACMATRSR